MAVRTWTAPGGVKSLRWDGADLVDLVGGGRRWEPDGTFRDSGLRWGFPFDRAAVAPSGRYGVLWTERGTKGLVLDLRGPKIVREVDRSHYRATDYDYPIALGRLPDGREVLVHCPEAYHRIEIEELVTGTRLTAGERGSVDVFHAQLEVSPDGRHLLSAGWVWAPLGVGHVHDVAAAFEDASTLDGDGLFGPHAGVDAEIGAACWLDADRVVMASTREALGWEEEPEFGTMQLGVWSVGQRRWLHRSPIDRLTGALLARGSQVVSLNGHPRLLDAATGRVVAEWPEVGVPEKTECYGAEHVPSAVAAVSPDGTRLAVGLEDGVAVIDLPEHRPVGRDGGVAKVGG
ncbi:hypothetical protein [Kitasatospora sp. NPDC088134]|uniref:hypothetical protein n=1 Tax=Kitasatospora sp. NPDC088134 TaxID=3364071 RepID=UPI0038154960